MSKGSIYILKNPAFKKNFLKIGRTKFEVEKRAKGLYTTGLPDPFDIVYQQDVPDCFLAEDLVHEALKDYRHRKQREFFVLPTHQAITIVQKVIQEKFYGIFNIPEETYVFDKGVTLRHSFQYPGIILLARYEDFISLATNHISIADMWWCKPKDHILITNRMDDAPESFVEFASNSCVPGSLSDIINLYPGDRLIIIESPSSKQDIHQLTLFNSPPAIRIVDLRDYARMVGFMEDIEIHPGGYIIPFGSSQHEEISPEDARKAVDKVINMGSPNTLPDPDYVRSLKSGFDYYT